jgi:MFS family permease
MGFVMALGIGVSVLFEMPSGVWADSWGRKNVVSIGLLFVAAELVTIALGKSFGYFLIAGFFGGVGSALISGADTALLYDSLKADKKEKSSKKVYGRVRAIRYWAIVLAALIGAPLYASHPTLPFLISAGLILLVAIFFQTMKEPPIITEQVTDQFKHFKDSFKEVHKNKKLLWYINFSIFSGASIWLFHDMLRSPYYESIGYTIAFLAVITAIITLTRSFFSLRAEWFEKKLSKNGIILLNLLAPIPLFFLMGLFYSKIALIFAIILYWVWSIQEVLTEVYIHEETSSKKRATVYSIHSFANSLMILIGSIIVGYITQTYSIKTMLYCLAGFNLVTSIMLLIKKKN